MSAFVPPGTQLVQTGAPYPFPAELGPASNQRGAIQYGVGLGPQDPGPAGAIPEMGPRKTYYTITHMIRARPYKHEPLHRHWINGQMMFVRRCARTGGIFDLSQEVRSLPQMNLLLQAEYARANALFAQRLAAGGATEALLKRATEAGWVGAMHARSEDNAERQLFEDYWPLSRAGIVERWALGPVLYLPNNTATHVPMAPGRGYADGAITLTLTVAARGVCDLRNVFCDASMPYNKPDTAVAGETVGAVDQSRLFMILKREALRDGAFGPYQWVPHAELRNTPRDDVLAYRDYSGTPQEAHWEPIGFVLDQRGVPPPDRDRMLRAQGRHTQVSEEEAFLLNTHLDLVHVCYTARTIDRRVIFSA